MKILDFGAGLKENHFEFHNSDKQHVVIANTIKGRGVSYMEDVWQYHTIIPKDEELLKIGMEDLS